MVDHSHNGTSPHPGVTPDDVHQTVPASPQRRFLFAQDTAGLAEPTLPVMPAPAPAALPGEPPVPATDPPAPAPDDVPDAPAQPRPSITDASLVVPPGVALMLDTALHGERATAGTPDAAGRPRAKNLAILVGTIRTATFGAGPRTRARTTRTPFGTFDHAYFLTIHAVVGDDTGVDRSSYRLPISMSAAVCARHQDLLVDGQRVAVLGPVSLEERYDSRFRRDAYDAGRPVWDVRLDVLAVQEVDATTPDMGVVQFEGEVAEVARYVSRPAGPYGLRETYALVYPHARELLPAPYGMARRPVVRVLSVEVLVDPAEELIPNSDALLRVGNKVRIEGHLGIRVQRLRSDETDVQAMLGQVAQRLTQRNAAALQREQEHRDANRQQPRGQRQALAGPRALSAEALERRISAVQQNLLSMQRVRIEVGAVELLSGTPLAPEERAQQMQQRRPRRRSAAPSADQPPDVSMATQEAALDQATVAALRPPAADTPEDAEPNPASHREPEPDHVEVVSAHAPDAPLPARRRRVTPVRMDGADAAVIPESLDAASGAPDA